MHLVERHRTVSKSGDPAAPIALRRLRTLHGLPETGSIRELLDAAQSKHTTRRPWAIILCRFKGEPPNPTVEAPIERIYREIFETGSGGLIEFWRDVTLGACDVAGSVVHGWVEVDMRRSDAGGTPETKPPGPGRSGLIDAAIAAARADGFDPVAGFHSQIAVYTENWSIPDAPAGADWSTPGWGQSWIDGSADGAGRVCLTPPHHPNIVAHEMGHGFGMNHDLGADMNGQYLVDYADPCCIMSTGTAFTHPRWDVPFGPALCLPHLMSKDWMYSRRLYTDTSNWFDHAAGIRLPLAPLDSPVERANLGLQLSSPSARGQWSYLIEYVHPRAWTRGLAQPTVFVRRFADHDAYKSTPAILLSIPVPATAGDEATADEATGGARFSVKWFDDEARILEVAVRRL